MFECLRDNLSGFRLSDGKLIRGNNDIEEHFDFPTIESGVCSKLSKIHFESFSSNTIPVGRNRLPQDDSIPSFTKEETDDFAVPRSIESMRCYIKGYLCYKTVTYQNVSSEAQVKNFLFRRKVMFHELKIFKFMYFKSLQLGFAFPYPLENIRNLKVF